LKIKSVNYNLNFYVAVAIALVGLLLLQGCVSIWPPPSDDAEARQWVEAANRLNGDLLQFKGLMEIRLESGQKVTSGRAAWLAAGPNRLRIDWLSMLGQPIFSLAADGKAITVLSYMDGEFHTLEQTPKAMNRLINVPMAIEDFLTLLAGRPLLPEFAAAQRMNTAEGADAIVLKDRWHRSQAVLVLDEGFRPQCERIFDVRGEMRYRIDWHQWQQMEQRTIPRKLRITAQTGEQIQIAVVRFWDRADVDPSVFSLERPPLRPE
jgi:outer membrane biogenesis lipoprotein LolB